MSTRVALADDDVLLRQGIASLLREAGYDVVAEASDGAGARDLASASPDIVVMDIRMPPTNTTEGLDAAAALRGSSPGLAVLLLSNHVEIDTALELLEAGESVGYLLKTRVLDAADFLNAVERVAAGGCVVDPALVQELVAGRHRSDPLDQLTPREREVLELMAEGRSNGGIAQRLWITEGAVEKHVRNILAKLGLPATADDHRRVLAVLTFLESR